MAGAVGSFRSGKGGRLLVGNATYLKGMGWTVKESNGEQDTTNFECWTSAYGSSGSGGGRSFYQGLVGIETATGHYNGNWDAATNAMDSPPGIYQRDDGPAMNLILNRTDSTAYAFLATIIGGVDIGVDIKGLVTFAFDFKNQGPYTRPTGSYNG